MFVVTDLDWIEAGNHDGTSATVSCERIKSIRVCQRRGADGYIEAWRPNDWKYSSKRDVGQPKRQSHTEKSDSGCHSCEETGRRSEDSSEMKSVVSKRWSC